MREYKDLLMMSGSIIRKSVILTVILIFCQPFLVEASKNNPKETIEEQIWNLEHSYFRNLYKANYDSVLMLVDEKFLGWPNSVEIPLDKAGSSVFMKKLNPSPTQCIFTIERKGISVVGNIAITQYIINVSCPLSDGTKNYSSSRISHTWINTDNSWRLLGGMSYNK
jgi:hypothetical protein